MDVQKSYQDAWSRCDADGNFLAVPRTDEDQACLLKMASGKRAWLGLERTESVHQFRAADGLSRFGLDHRFWGPGQPGTTATENCVELLPDGWNDCMCSNVGPRPFCQTPTPADCPN